MENKNTSFITKSILYGLFTGLVFIIITVLIYLLNVNMLTIGFGIGIFLTNAIILIVAMILGIKEIRNKVFEGVLSYGGRVLAGFLIGFTGSVISGLFSLWFFTYYDPGFILDRLPDFVDNLIDKGLPEDQAYKMEEDIREGFTVTGQLKSMFMKGPIMYAVIALIVSAFIKKKSESDTTI
jgi:hypothetical protein